MRPGLGNNRKLPKGLAPASLPKALTLRPGWRFHKLWPMIYLHSQDSLPMFSGLKAATTSSRGQAFQ